MLHLRLEIQQEDPLNENHLSALQDLGDNVQKGHVWGVGRRRRIGSQQAMAPLLRQLDGYTCFLRAALLFHIHEKQASCSLLFGHPPLQMQNLPGMDAHFQ